MASGMTEILVGGGVKAVSGQTTRGLINSLLRPKYTWIAAFC